MKSIIIYALIGVACVIGVKSYFSAKTDANPVQKIQNSIQNRLQIIDEL